MSDYEICPGCSSAFVEEWQTTELTSPQDADPEDARVVPSSSESTSDEGWETTESISSIDSENDKEVGHQMVQESSEDDKSKHSLLFTTFKSLQHSGIIGPFNDEENDGWETMSTSSADSVAKIYGSAARSSMSPRGQRDAEETPPSPPDVGKRRKFQRIRVPKHGRVAPSLSLIHKDSSETRDKDWTSKPADHQSREGWKPIGTKVEPFTFTEADPSLFLFGKENCPDTKNPRQNENCSPVGNCKPRVKKLLNFTISNPSFFGHDGQIQPLPSAGEFVHPDTLLQVKARDQKDVPMIMTTEKDVTDGKASQDHLSPSILVDGLGDYEDATGVEEDIKVDIDISDPEDVTDEKASQDHLSPSMVVDGLGDYEDATGYEEDIKEDIDISDPEDVTDEIASQDHLSPSMEVDGLGDYEDATGFEEDIKEDIIHKSDPEEADGISPSKKGNGRFRQFRKRCSRFMRAVARAITCGISQKAAQ